MFKITGNSQPELAFHPDDTGLHAVGSASRLGMPRPTPIVGPLGSLEELDRANVDAGTADRNWQRTILPRRTETELGDLPPELLRDGVLELSAKAIERLIFTSLEPIPAETLGPLRFDLAQQTRVLSP